MVTFNDVMSRYRAVLCRRTVINELINFLARYIEQENYKMPLGDDMGFVPKEHIQYVKDILEKEFLNTCEAELQEIEKTGMEDNNVEPESPQGSSRPVKKAVQRRTNSQT